jgi:hypothetical protein
VTPLFLAVWLAYPVPEIAGDCTCPTPAEVRERLVPLADSGAGETTDEIAPHRAYLSSTNQSVHVELLAADGNLLAERSLDRTGTCSDVAEAVAVVLATWEAKLNPNLATPVAPLPAPPAPAPERVVATKAEPAPPRPMPFDAGLALLASVVGGEAVFGARIEGCLFPSDVSIGLHAALSATSTHTQSIATPASDAQWMRAALSVGPNYRLGQAAPGLDVHASAVLALLHVQGAALPKTSSDTSLQLGLAAGLRGLWAWNNAAGWVGTDIFVYPGDDRLTIGNYGDVGRLSRLEVQIAVGMALGHFR